MLGLINADMSDLYNTLRSSMSHELESYIEEPVIIDVSDSFYIVTGLVNFIQSNGLKRELALAVVNAFLNEVLTHLVNEPMDESVIEFSESLIQEGLRGYGIGGYDTDPRLRDILMQTLPMLTVGIIDAISITLNNTPILTRDVFEDTELPHMFIVVSRLTCTVIHGSIKCRARVRSFTEAYYYVK